MANGTINRDLDVLRGVLKRAKRWHLMADDVRPLPVRESVGRALAYAEKLRLLKIADTRPEWVIARLALALNTTMRACEIRGLHWRDVNFMERTISVQRNTTKTDAGERAIPLNAVAWAAILEQRERAKLLFGTEPQAGWYVFPHAGGLLKFDPAKPMSGWRTAWRNLTRAIDCPACGQLQKPGVTCRNEECKSDISGLKSSTAGLRFHDLRHHAITELAESQTSDQTIMSIAGHVSPKMLATYSHIRMDAKRKALDALSGRASGGSYGTNDGTNPQYAVIPDSQVIDRIGGREGARTPDLLVANEALSQLSYTPTAGKLNAKRASNSSKRAKLHQTRLPLEVPCRTNPRSRYSQPGDRRDASGALDRVCDVWSMRRDLGARGVHKFHKPVRQRENSLRLPQAYCIFRD
jgi:integrase